MSEYSKGIDELSTLRDANKETWAAISPESAMRMRMQNRFRTGLDIARYTADIMRQDMENYDNDSAKYTQSLGC